MGLIPIPAYILIIILIVVLIVVVALLIMTGVVRAYTRKNEADLNITEKQLKEKQNTKTAPEDE